MLTSALCAHKLSKSHMWTNLFMTTLFKQRAIAKALAFMLLVQCRGILAVAAASTCVELGFARVTSRDEKAAAPNFQAYSPASAMAVLFTFSAAGAFVQVGVGYIEAHFDLITYGGSSLQGFKYS